MFFRCLAGGRIRIPNMEHIGMTRMFKSLEDTGLKGFLEVPTSVYEDAITEFFVNAKVIAGTIVSFVCNQKMVINEDEFSTTFRLPTKGMTGFLDIPKDTMMEMRSRFSETDVPFRAPSKKREMKVEYRFLHDIVAKSLCTKSGSFDTVTSEKFELIVVISAGLTVKWGKILFRVLLGMVNNPKKQSQGFAVQVSILLTNLLKADLGESVKLHPQKMLTKAVQTYIKKNLEIKPAGESSKQTEDTASNTEGEVLAGGAEVSGDEQVDDGLEGHERMDSDQYVQRGGEDLYEENLEYDTQMDHRGQNEVASTTAQDEPRMFTDGCPERETFDIADWVDNRNEKATDNVERAIVVRSGHELPALLTMTYTGQGIFAPIQIREINRSSGSDPTLIVDPSVNIADTVNNPGPDPTSVDNNADHKGPNPSHIQMVAFTADCEEEPTYSSSTAQNLPTMMMDTQTSLKVDFGRHKHVFHDKMNTLADNVTSYQTALETSIIRQLAGQQHQLTTDLDMIKLQLAELVENLKWVGDAKKGEGGQSRPLDRSSRQGGKRPSGGQSSIRGRGPSPRGGRGPSPGRYIPGEDSERFKYSKWF
ncbi:hypothetical protein F511_33509 [Dorcoceras hygrometricum]|uniref:Dystroglycan-like n=1 Tax=Dorcoceras hygrometricum TaxID=472368 RepID=A0A2Z7C0B9_9LAMI|nr:hypothetical protein F511_33509 [Dorcoceras hygrometricum]